VTARRRSIQVAHAFVLLAMLTGCFAFNSNHVRVQRTTSMKQELDDLDRALAVGAINAEERDMLETELTSRVRASSPAVFRRPAQ